MPKLVLSIAVSAILALGAYWLHARFGLSIADAVGLVGLLGAAAAVVPFIVDKWPGRKCKVSNVYVHLGGQDWVNFHFEAYVLNAAKDADVLTRVRYVFYHRRSGRFPLLLIFGAREIGRDKGQILPSPLKPSQTYFVEARDTFEDDSPRGRRLRTEGDAYTDYIFVCKFVFAQSRAVTVRVHPHSLKLPDRFASWLEERRLGVEWDRTATT